MPYVLLKRRCVFDAEEEAYLLQQRYWVYCNT